VITTVNLRVSYAGRRFSFGNLRKGKHFISIKCHKYNYSFVNSNPSVLAYEAGTKIFWTERDVNILRIILLLTLGGYSLLT